MSMSVDDLRRTALFGAKLSGYGAVVILVAGKVGEFAGQGGDEWRIVGTLVGLGLGSKLCGPLFRALDEVQHRLAHRGQ